MRVETTGGTVTAVQDPLDPSRVRVSATDMASLQIVLDGVELVAGGEAPPMQESPPEPTGKIFWASVSKREFASWLAFEAVEYITYTEFPDA